MKIVLFEPEIPQNTGNIIRTCSVTHTELVLIEPLGFKITDKQLKRAGLDYYKTFPISLEKDLFEFLEKNAPSPFYFLSSKGKTTYTDIQFPKDSIFIFGAETSGLPEQVFLKWPERCLTIPMITEARCLNLSNCVAIVLYEALRQQNFEFPIR